MVLTIFNICPFKLLPWEWIDFTLNGSLYLLCLILTHSVFLLCMADCYYFNNPVPFFSFFLLRTFIALWKQVAQNLDRYNTYPRLVGGNTNWLNNIFHLWWDLKKSVQSQTCNIFSFLFDWHAHLERYILVKNPIWIRPVVPNLWAIEDSQNNKK